METLGQYCFYSCPSLHRVRLPNTLTTMADGYEFYQCYALTDIKMPTGVVGIGVNTLGYCSGLTRITFEEGTEVIGSAALSTCRGLQRVDLPASLQTLAYNFASSTINLSELHIKATTPPSLNGTLATGYSNFVVYIPAGTLGAYSSADRWSSIAAKLIEE